MKWRGHILNITVSICLSALSGIVYAADQAATIDLPTAASVYTHNIQSLKSQSFDANHAGYGPYLLAANENDGLPEEQLEAVPGKAFEPSWISGRKAHQYLGLGTIVFAGLTAMAAPDSEHQGATSQPRQTSGTTHTKLARTTIAMAAATVMTGLIYHWDDVHIEDGFVDPDNLHAMLGATGALLMAYAVHKSATSTVPTSHAGIAELGAATMVVAIKLTW